MQFLRFSLALPRPPSSTLLPYTTLFRSDAVAESKQTEFGLYLTPQEVWDTVNADPDGVLFIDVRTRSEEHTSELQYVAISYAVFCLKKKPRHKTTNRKQTKHY